MKNFIASNRFKIVVVSIVLITMGGIFYWYELRPSNIKKECHIKAQDVAVGKGGLAGLSGKFNKDDYDTYYKLCLHSMGL